MNLGNLQFALCQPGESVPAFLPAQTEWIPRVSSLVTILILAALFATLPVEAAGVARLAASEVEQPTDVIGGAHLLGVRCFSQANYSRVVIDLSMDIPFTIGQLSNPERVYLDFPRAEINPSLSIRRIAVQNGLIDQVRIWTNRGPVTRVVLDLTKPVRYRLSKVDKLARIVIELSQPTKDKVLAKSVQISTKTLLPSIDDSRSRAALPAGKSAAFLPRDEDVPPGSPAGPQTYGNGEEETLNYAGGASPRDVLLLGFNTGSTYDDNIFGNNKRRSGGVYLLVEPSVSISREGSHLSLALNYQPQFHIYPRDTGLNTLNQIFGFDASYRMSPRVTFRARTNAFYTNGIFQPGQNEEFLPGLGYPTSLNQTVYTPTAQQFSSSSRVDASYRTSLHDSLGVYFGESILDFNQQVSTGDNLQNTHEHDAGLLYQHRLGIHNTLGALYQFEQIQFGSDPRTTVHSVFFSYAQQVSPSVTISIFGGPQRSSLNGLISFSSPLLSISSPVLLTSWNWGLGGTLTKRLNKSVFELSAQHQVSNGGGLIGAVISTSVGTSIRWQPTLLRRPTGHWDAIWNANYAKNSSLGSGTLAGSYSSVIAGFGLERSLTDKVSIRLGYDFLHQRGSEASPLLVDIDRNLFSIQFSYRIRQVVLGKQ